MKRIVLSVEQMKHLEELGLDTSDASHIWFEGHLLVNHMPCWCIKNNYIKTK